MKYEASNGETYIIESDPHFSEFDWRHSSLSATATHDPRWGIGDDIEDCKSQIESLIEEEEKRFQSFFKDNNYYA